MILLWKSFNIKLDRMHRYLSTNLANYDGMVSSPEQLEIMFKNPATVADEQFVYAYWDSLTSTTETTPTSEEILANVRTVINKAITFGAQLTIEFASDNVLNGITQAGKTRLIADACQKAFYYLSTGSLYEARAEMLSITLTSDMAPFLTRSRVIDFVNKIETYLGLPLTT